jgi:hypothetical protein
MCDECNTREQVNHRQVVCDPQPAYAGPEYYDSTAPVRVDTGMHALLQAIWSKGYETQFSCEGWPYGSEGGKQHGTRGYILFRRVEHAIEFFVKSHDKAAARSECLPHIVLETAIGLSEDMSYLDEHLPARGVIRFENADLHTLEELWTA